MRLIVLVAIAFIPLIASSPIELGDGFSLPALENIESHVDNLWANFKKGYGIIYTIQQSGRSSSFQNFRNTCEIDYST